MSTIEIHGNITICRGRMFPISEFNAKWPAVLDLVKRVTGSFPSLCEFDECLPYALALCDERLRAFPGIARLLTLDRCHWEGTCLASVQKRNDSPVGNVSGGSFDFLDWNRNVVDRETLRSAVRLQGMRLVPQCGESYLVLDLQVREHALYVQARFQENCPANSDAEKAFRRFSKAALAEFDKKPSSAT